MKKNHIVAGFLLVFFTAQNTLATAETQHGYAQVLSDITRAVQTAQITAQIKAILSVNQELLKLYWSIGEKIAVRQQTSARWGIQQLAEDLQKTFPERLGFSPRNIFRMQAFFLAYREASQSVAHLTDLPVFNIPWGHNAIILEKIKSTEERLWYAQKAIDNGWSRSSLASWIETGLYKHNGNARLALGNARVPQTTLLWRNTQTISQNRQII